MERKSPIFQQAMSIAELVFSPDYYNGPWWIYFRSKKKRCINYATANAFAKYLIRQYGSWSENEISIGKIL